MICKKHVWKMIGVRSCARDKPTEWIDWCRTCGSIRTERVSAAGRMRREIRLSDPAIDAVVDPAPTDRVEAIQGPWRSRIESVSTSAGHEHVTDAEKASAIRVIGEMIGAGAPQPRIYSLPLGGLLAEWDFGEVELRAQFVGGDVRLATLRVCS